MRYHLDIRLAFVLYSITVYLLRETTTCVFVNLCVCVSQELLKYSPGSERTSELQGALAAMLELLKSVNDSMHQIAITGYEVEIFNTVTTLPISACEC